MVDDANAHSPHKIKKLAVGFTPFFTLDANLGVHDVYAKKVNFAFNFGIRNITDEVYHEAFLHWMVWKEMCLVMYH